MANVFFGVQVAVEIPRVSAAREGLSACVRDLQGRRDIAAQRTGWQEFTRIAREVVPSIRRGSWDLIDDGAEGTYEEWASGLEAMAEWQESEFGSGGDLLLVTQIALVSGGSNAARTLGDICDIPKAGWHRRSTYAALLAVMPKLNLTNLLGSGLYLAPRPDQPGFSVEVLSGEGFEYLVPVA